MLLCTCHRCDDTFPLRVEPKTCRCGAITGAMINSMDTYVSGAHSIFEVTDKLKTLPTGTMIRGVVIKNNSKSIYKTHSIEN